MGEAALRCNTVALRPDNCRIDHHSNYLEGFLRNSVPEAGVLASGMLVVADRVAGRSVVVVHNFLVRLAFAGIAAGRSFEGGGSFLVGAASVAEGAPCCHTLRSVLAAVAYLTHWEGEDAVAAVMVRDPHDAVRRSDSCSSCRPPIRDGSD